MKERRCRNDIKFASYPLDLNFKSPAMVTDFSQWLSSISPRKLRGSTVHYSYRAHSYNQYIHQEMHLIEVVP
jgi:hypothetical protein